MGETEDQLSGPDAEIETLLRHLESETVAGSNRFRVAEERTLEDGSKVRLSIWQDNGKLRHRTIGFSHPLDEAGRYVSESYDLSEHTYESYEMPDHKDWRPIKCLDDRDMTPEDDSTVQDWLERFKSAPPTSSESTEEEA